MAPFLEVLQSQETSGTITGVALASILRIVTANVIGTLNSQPAIALALTLVPALHVHPAPGMHHTREGIWHRQLQEPGGKTSALPCSSCSSLVVSLDKRWPAWAHRAGPWYRVQGPLQGTGSSAGCALCGW